MNDGKILPLWTVLLEILYFYRQVTRDYTCYLASQIKSADSQLLSSYFYTLAYYWVVS